MSIRIDTYSLLVDKFGESTAYKICEELGGTEIKIPKKAHKGYRIRRLVNRAIENKILSDEKRKTRVVKWLASSQSVTVSAVYTIIREVEDERRKQKS